MFLGFKPFLYVLHAPASPMV